VPSGVGTAASTYQPPAGVFAGKPIEACGLTGRRAGGGAVTPNHANWFVNAPGAGAADVLALCAVVRDEVRARHGVELEMEVKVIGDDD
jgi:UDP-N-acetylmuramate dehydrogenase